MRIVFFSPYSGINLHSGPEWQLMEGLTQSGHLVTAVTCSGTLQAFCNVMASISLTPGCHQMTKRLVCRACNASKAKLVRKFSDIDVLDMGAWLGAEDFQEAANVCNQVDGSSWMSLEVNGVPVGRLASYEFLLTHKLSTELIPDRLIEEFRNYLTSVVLSLKAATRLLPVSGAERLVTYNGRYGANRAWKLVAEDMGIPSYTIHGGMGERTRYDRLMLYRDDSVQSNLINSVEAQRAMEVPLREAECETVERDLKLREASVSAFTYSPPISERSASSIRSELRIPRHNRVFLVALSSTDEVFAASMLDATATSGSTVFRDQLDWLHEILEISREHSDWTFIVRLHPRMMPNIREDRVAPVVGELMTLLRTRPDNVLLDSPSAHRSVYDLFKIADVGLVRSSTVGLEMIARGIPVACADRSAIRGFPPSLARVASSRVRYRELLERSLEIEHIENAVGALRAWRYLYFRDYLVSRTVPWRDPERRHVEGLPPEGLSTSNSTSIARSIKRHLPIPHGSFARAVHFYIRIRRGDSSPPPGQREAETHWVKPFDRTLRQAKQSLVDSPWTTHLKVKMSGKLDRDFVHVNQYLLLRRNTYGRNG